MVVVMGLIACPDCNRQVSDIAPSCPGCGRPFFAMMPQAAQSAPPPYAPQAVPRYVAPGVPQLPPQGPAPDAAQPIRHPAADRKLGCLLGGFLVTTGVLGALQCLAGILGGLDYASEVTGRPFSGWAFWIGLANIGGVFAAWKWDRSGAGLIAGAWAAVIVLGLVDQRPESVVAGVPMLIVSLIVFAAAPWSLHCARCRVPIWATTTQCRNCGQQYWPAVAAGALSAARPADVPGRVMPPVGRPVWVPGSDGDWLPGVVVEQGAQGQVCVQVPLGASARYDWFDAHQLRPRDR